MKKPLEKIDFNLLKALHVLLEERSVTRAAHRLFVSQSAMSKTLHRLRALFDDPLLVRVGANLVPTPRADDLVEPLREIVVKVGNCLAPPVFSPVSVEGRVRIASPEQFAFVTVPELLIRLREKAPRLLLDSQHLMDQHLDLLAAGLLDFAVRRDAPYSGDFCSTQLYSAMPMCWCRKGHALIKKQRIGLADICAYPLVTLRTQNFSEEDIQAVRREIAAASLQRETILDTNHVLIAIDALMRCDALMLAPDFLSRLPLVNEAIHPIPILQIPVFSRFRTDMFLVQHKRTLNSPLHRWLASEISDVFSVESFAK